MPDYILRHSDLRIQTERAWLDALLSHAPDVRGLVVICVPHLARLRESREDLAAQVYRDAGFGTLLVSMLTAYEESRDPDVRYDISRLHHRLEALLVWLDQQPALSGLPLGLLSVSTLASACVRQLANAPTARVSALVSRAGRIDLAGAEPLRRLTTPLLMLVPGADKDLLAPAEQAFSLVAASKQWQRFDEASASFNEPDVLDASSQLACNWFAQHLPLPSPPYTGDEAVAT